MSRYLRSNNEPAPRLAGRHARYRWPLDDSEQRLIEAEIQEGGKGLWVLLSPVQDNVKVLVEAYYPEDIRADYFKNQLDPMRRVDYQDGHLVTVAEVAQWVGPLPKELIYQIRKNNRNARKELRRKSTAYDRELEMKRLQEEQEKPIFDAYEDQYQYAAREHRRAAAPKISTYTPRGTR